jgi:hypothetical protein
MTAVQQTPAPQAQLSQAFVKAEEFRKIIEVEVLRIIKELAEKGETPREKIQDIASTTLSFIQPGMNLEKLFTNAVKLDDKYSELAPVVVKIMRIYEDEYEQKALEQVSALVKHRQFNEANDLIKKVLMFKVG